MVVTVLIGKTPSYMGNGPNTPGKRLRPSREVGDIWQVGEDVSSFANHDQSLSVAVGVSTLERMASTGHPFAVIEADNRIGNIEVGKVNSGAIPVIPFTGAFLGDIDPA
jgi:hypothetical protein